MNYKYNGYKVLTSVGSESLYSTAIGRVRNLTRTNLLTFLANVAGERVCRNMFGKEECSFWSDEHDYIFGLQKTQELKAKNYTNDKINDALTALAIEEIMKKPFQYTFLTMAEGLKLVFWESTLIGYVNYPQWLQKIFLFTIFKNGLRLIIFFLTFISIMFSIIYCLRNLREIYIFDDSKNNITLHLLFMLVIIITNTALYAPFKSVPRYGFQVVPLYLITIGCMLDIIFARRR
ncbi:MAG: hypothetical protein KC684_03355 [Candidatus Omnitrophica bacterium]|nr:hypothetical protein [Candidatus Omnitrophota bacterium]